MARNKTKETKEKKGADPNDTEEGKIPKSLPARGSKPSGSIVPSDPFQRYLTMVRNTPRLTEDEVRILALRVHKDKDEDAALKLVTAHLRLVVNIAFEFRNQFQNMLDLIQEGNIGLMRAVEKFDPFKGVPLPAYAGYWIRAFILRYILDNWRLVRVGTTNIRRKLLFNLNKVTQELKAAGINPGPKQLAEHFNATEADVVAVQKSLGSSDVSMDAPVADDSERTFAEVIGEEAPGPFDDLSAKELTELVQRHIGEFAKNLKSSDKSILYDRLMSEEPLTLAEIGEMHKVTREAIRQAEGRLIKKLKKYLEEKIPGIGDFQFISKK